MTLVSPVKGRTLVYLFRFWAMSSSVRSKLAFVLLNKFIMALTNDYTGLLNGVDHGLEEVRLPFPHLRISTTTTTTMMIPTQKSMKGPKGGLGRVGGPLLVNIATTAIVIESIPNAVRGGITGLLPGPGGRLLHSLWAEPMRKELCRHIQICFFFYKEFYLVWISFGFWGDYITCIKNLLDV